MTCSGLTKTKNACKIKTRNSLCHIHSKNAPRRLSWSKELERKQVFDPEILSIKRRLSFEKPKRSILKY